MVKNTKNETKSENVILNEIEDKMGMLPFLYLKIGHHFSKTFFENVPILIFPLCHSMLKLQVENISKLIDVFSVPLVPAKTKFGISSYTSFSEFLILKITNEICLKTKELYFFHDSVLDDLMKEYIDIPRNNWLNEIRKAN